VRFGVSVLSSRKVLRSDSHPNRYITDISQLSLMFGVLLRIASVARRFHEDFQPLPLVHARRNFQTTHKVYFDL
jgi:hypothetical protein